MAPQKKQKVFFIVAMTLMGIYCLYVAINGRPKWMTNREPFQVAITKCASQ